MWLNHRLEERSTKVRYLPLFKTAFITLSRKELHSWRFCVTQVSDVIFEFRLSHQSSCPVSHCIVVAAITSKGHFWWWCWDCYPTLFSLDNTCFLRYYKKMSLVPLYKLLNKYFTTCPSPTLTCQNTSWKKTLFLTSFDNNQRAPSIHIVIGVAFN